MPPRRAKKGAVLQTISENVTVDDNQKEAVKSLVQTIKNIENEVEERVNSIVSTTEDMIISLKNSLKASIVRLPKKTRDMLVSEFLAKYPKDFKTDAIQEIRQRFAAMADEAAKAIPPATQLTKKRTIESNPSPTRAVRPKRGQEQDTVDLSSLPQAKEEQPLEQQPPTATVDTDTQQQQQQQKKPQDSMPPPQPPQPIAKPSFNDLPLQTPMPFAGEAIQLPFTMIARKRGGRTRAAPAPDAAVITTADGMQWALGKDGMSSIPESHRAEIEGMLNDQVSFLMKTLGKSVFEFTR